MVQKLEFLLRHDGRDWMAIHEDRTMRAPSLDGLDAKVRTYLKQHGYLHPGERAKVFMTFDNRDIPQWIRQYSQHYFNRIIKVSG
ncbi:DUF5395 family protein [Acidobacteriota bacterium]